MSPYVSWVSSTVTPAGEDHPAQSPIPVEPPVEASPDSARPLEPIHAAPRGASIEAHSRFLHIVEQGAVLRRAGTQGD